jgi:hypothetical protein
VNWNQNKPIERSKQMLGEQIGQGQGKRTGRRVVCTDPQFKVEVSFEEMTKLLGIDGMNIGTYVSWTKPDGSLHGEGEGVFASAPGEMVTWKGIGVGRFGSAGAVSYRGAVSYSTSSPKFARLNAIAGVFEFEVDTNGVTHSQMWEWK